MSGHKARVMTFGGKDYHLGEAVTLPEGCTLTPVPVPFAFAVTSDGQTARLEAPTLDGLLALIAATDQDREPEGGAA